MTTVAVDHFLDITRETCPMTFVRTKLLLERLEVGALVRIRLNSGEPLDNVPRAVTDHGHEVLALTPVGPADGVWELTVRRR